MSIEKYNSIITVHTKLFRDFTRDHGRTQLRRLLYALENNHSAAAIATQLALPLETVQSIRNVFQRAA